jgi:hypothetical protein
MPGEQAARANALSKFFKTRVRLFACAATALVPITSPEPTAKLSSENHDIWDNGNPRGMFFSIQVARAEKEEFEVVLGLSAVALDAFG